MSKETVTIQVTGAEAEAVAALIERRMKEIVALPPVPERREEASALASFARKMHSAISARLN